MALTTNLVSNPSFKDGTTSWAATGGSTTIAAALTGGLYGVHCLTVTKSADANVGAVTDTTTITVTVGNTYVASAYIKVPTGEESGSFKVGIGFYTSGNSLVGSIQYSGTTTITAASGWTRLYQTYVAPATSAYAKVYVVQSNTATAAETFLIDAVQFENSYDPNTFVETLTQGQETAAVNDGLRPVPVPHLTGLELNADIMLNDLLLNTVDYNKCVWVCTGIDGWWGVPAPEVPELTRGLDDGSYDVRGRWTARDMTLTGTILVPNRDYAEVARQRLIEAISLVHSGGWLFVGESPTKAAYVRLSGRPEIENVNARGRMNFSVGLRAANPVKFSWNWNDQNGYESANVAAAGSTAYVNSGNIEVPVDLSLEGPLTAPINIVNTTSSKTLKIVKDLRGAGNVKTITNAVQSGTTVTLTVGASHGFLANDVINVNDVTTAGYTDLNNDNAVTLTSVASTTITYTSGTSRTLTSAACDGNVIRNHAKAITNAVQTTTSVTLTFASGHSFLEGDVVSVSGVSTVGYTGLNSDDSVTITAVTSTTVSYTSGTSRTLTSAACNGYLYLDSKDTLVIDTYNKSATFRGSAGIARSYIDAVVDWITLAPGSNTITFTPTSGTTQLNVKHRSGWIG
jgi:hypothetical protein